MPITATNSSSRSLRKKEIHYTHPLQLMAKKIIKKFVSAENQGLNWLSIVQKPRS